VFVRTKKVKGNTYYQLVRNYREDGKHKQQVLCHLGQYRSLEDAIETERNLAENDENEAASLAKEAQAIKERCYREYPEVFSGDFPSRREAYYWRWFAADLPTRWQDARNVLELVLEYHDCKDWARESREWAAAHKARLDKFLECTRRYF
jgi:hypothetical protein